MKNFTNTLKRLDKPLTFYSYLGSHSFLIGLLPFYLPVFLWGHGFQLADIALLIAATGCGFSLSLKQWQTVAKTQSLRSILYLTFVVELFLVSTLLMWPGFAEGGYLGIDTPASIGAIGIGIVSGVYNAWFWTTQRTLFLDMTQNTNTGRQYGNFQIFVTVFLKVGILIGGLLLDSTYGHWALLALTIIVCAGMCYWYQGALCDERLIINQESNVSLASSFNYRDACRSFPVFILDGIFLFLESHFWLLSLFLVVQEDFSSLGLIVVALALFFAITFWLLKNTIDAFTGNSVYIVATGLYALSWLFRSYIDADLGRNALLISLMLITFCSSFFRLAFNKRFFDLARTHEGTQYLLIKSYISQFVLAVSYGVLALILFSRNGTGESSFTAVYLLAAVLSLGYALYRQPPAPT